jgi:hypothetical protein
MKIETSKMLLGWEPTEYSFLLQYLLYIRLLYCIIATLSTRSTSLTILSTGSRTRDNYCWKIPCTVLDLLYSRFEISQGCFQIPRR